MELQNQEAACLLSAGGGLERFDLALKRARRERDLIKKLYLAHTRKHGC